MPLFAFFALILAFCAVAILSKLLQLVVEATLMVVMFVTAMVGEVCLIWRRHHA